MILLTVILAATSTISPETVPGSVIIPTWLLISAISVLGGAIGSMFWVFVRGHKREITFMQGQLKDKTKECKTLGKLLDSRYKDVKELVILTSSAVEIIKLAERQGDDQ